MGRRPRAVSLGNHTPWFRALHELADVEGNFLRTLSGGVSELFAYVIMVINCLIISKPREL